MFSLMKSDIRNTDNNKNWFIHSIAGGFSGALTRFFCQPFDVIKIRFQLQVEPLSVKSNNSKYKSIYQSVCLITKEEGFTALWKGHIPGQFLSVTYGLTQFAVFQKSLSYISETKKELNQTSRAHFISGVLASTSATLLSYPCDVVRTRLVAQKSNQVNYASNILWVIYINMRQVIISIHRNEGLSAYYRGLFPTLIQNSLQGGFIFMFYNAFSKFFLTNTSSTINSSNNMSSLNQLCSGFFAGLISKTLLYPLDMAKKRLQLQDFNRFRDGFGKKFICDGLFNCILLTVKGESITALFKGLSPSLLKAGLVTALHFTFYEQTYKLLNILVKDY